MLAAILRPFGCALCSQIVEWLLGTDHNLFGMVSKLDCKNENGLSSIHQYVKFVNDHNQL